MSNILFVLIVIFYFVCYVSSLTPADCGANEKFHKRSIACESTCDLPNPPKIWPCVTAPSDKCLCKPNFFRDNGGPCVRIEDCPPPKACGPNQVLKMYSTDCDNFCDFPVRPPGSMCSTAPFNKCVCKEGYYRTDMGDCVHLEDCKKWQGKV